MELLQQVKFISASIAAAVGSYLCWKQTMVFVTVSLTSLPWCLDNLLRFRLLREHHQMSELNEILLGQVYVRYKDIPYWYFFISDVVLGVMLVFKWLTFAHAPYHRIRLCSSSLTAGCRALIGYKIHIWYDLILGSESGRGRRRNWELGAFKRMVRENEMHEYGARKRDARIWIRLY